MCQPLERYSVLIIEDDDANAEALCELITIQKIYKPYVAKSEQEAMDLFCSDKYVIVFVDLKIGNDIDNGIRIIQKIRELDQNIFIVVVTAYYEYIFNKKIVDSVDDFVRKPIDIDFFSSKLFLWTTKYNRRKEIIEAFNQKCVVFNDKFTDYESRLSGLDEIDLKIEELISKIGSEKLYGEGCGL